MTDDLPRTLIDIARTGMAPMITLQIVPANSDQITFRPVGGTYADIAKAMKAAKKLAGRGAEYWGDGLSIRYAGPNGTVYLCGVKP